MPGRIEYQAYRADRRRFFVLDHVLDDAAARSIHRRFAVLPVTLTDADRPDTAHVRHLKHDFAAEEWDADPALSLLAQVARHFLRARRIGIGPLYRIYANFNLHGDFQFAHEDGEGWTALTFINARWHEDWGGELLMYAGADGPCDYAIAPRPGRMVLFDGMIPHRGGVPSKLCMAARISLAMKFRPPARVD